MHPQLLAILLDCITFFIHILRRLQTHLTALLNEDAYDREIGQASAEELPARAQPTTYSGTRVRANYQERPQSFETRPVTPEEGPAVPRRTRHGNILLSGTTSRPISPDTLSTSSTVINTPDRSITPSVQRELPIRSPAQTWRSETRAIFNTPEGYCGHYCHTVARPRIAWCGWCLSHPSSPRVATLPSGERAPTAEPTSS